MRFLVLHNLFMFIALCYVNSEAFLQSVSPQCSHLHLQLITVLILEPEVGKNIAFNGSSNIFLHYECHLIVKFA